MRTIIVAFLTVLLFPVMLSGQQGFSIKQAKSWIIQQDFNKSDEYKLVDMDQGGIYLLADFQTHIEKQMSYSHFAIKLISESGTQNYSDIWVDYDPSYQKLMFHQLQIIRNGKYIDKLEQEKFKVVQNESELNRKLYNGTYSAGIFLEDTQVGDIIEYAYTIEGFNPIFKDQYFTGFNLQYNVPVKKLYHSLLYKDSRKVNYKILRDGPAPVRSEKNGLKHLYWKRENLEDLVENSGVPTWYSSYPYVSVSTFTEWKELIEWALPLYPYDSEMSTAVSNKIQEVKSAYSDPEAQINAIIRIVQDDIRYMGIEVNEYSYRPHDPNLTFTKKYGDCKDKSFLLSYMLKKAGFVADVAFVNTKKRSFITDYLPSPVIFNHVIVMLSYDGEKYFIDPTLNFQTAGFTNLYSGNYGKAVVINKKYPEPVDIPVYSQEKIKIIEVFQVKDTLQPVEYSITSTYSGSEADNIRSSKSNSSTNELNNSYINFYSYLYADMEFAEDLKYEDTDDPGQVKVIEKYRINDFWEYDESVMDYVCMLNASNLSYYLSDHEERNRNNPLAIYHPVEIENRIIFHHSKAIEIEKMQGEVRNNSFRFDYTVYQMNDQTIVFDYHYQTLKDHVAIEEMDAYFQDIDEISELIYYEFTYGSGPGNSKGTNWIMVMLSTFFVIILLFIAPFVYRWNMGLKTKGNPIPLGGWLILPIIGVFLTPLIIIYQLYNFDFYNLEVWELLSSPKSDYYDSWFVISLIYEVLINWFFIIYSLFLIVLIIKRRNIFPYHYVIFRILNLSLLIIDLILVQNISSELYDSGQENNTEIYRSVIGAAIWIPYMLLSQRVKDTFTRPFGKTPPEDFIAAPASGSESNDKSLLR